MHFTHINVHPAFYTACGTIYKQFEVIRFKRQFLCEKEDELI